MITLQLRHPVRGGGYETVLTLRVTGDGHYSVSGDADIDLEQIPIPDRQAAGGRLMLGDDPARWARNAHKAFRTGYLVPLLTEEPDPID